MGKIIAEVLRVNICELNGNLSSDSVAELVNRLWSQTPRLLSSNEKEDILSRTTRQKQVDALVMVLHGKDDRALDVVHAYLKEAGYTELVKSIEKSASQFGHALPDSSETKEPTKESKSRQVMAKVASGSNARTGEDNDFPITSLMIPEIRKQLEESEELIGSWLTIKDDFVEKAVHKTEITTIYNGLQPNAKPVAISTTLEKWRSRGKSVATFNKLIAIVKACDTDVAEELEANRDKIRAMGDTRAK